MFHIVRLVLSALHLFFLCCLPFKKKKYIIEMYPKCFSSLLHDYLSSLSVWEDPVLLVPSLYRFQNASMLSLKEAILKNNCWANGTMPSLFKDVLQQFQFLIRVFLKTVWPWTDSGWLWWVRHVSKLSHWEFGGAPSLWISSGGIVIKQPVVMGPCFSLHDLPVLLGSMHLICTWF